MDYTLKDAKPRERPLPLTVSFQSTDVIENLGGMKLVRKDRMGNK